MIGEPAMVDGYALAGAIVIPAEGPTETRRAWRDLPPEVSLVVLTESAASVLADELRVGAGPLTAVIGA